VRIREVKMCTKCLLRGLKAGGHLEGLDVDGRIILKWICGKWFKRLFGFMSLRMRTVGEFL
jgi:hypothetical protein